uniref:PDS5 cohesin associated factor A n=1 Tax=Cercocebus atys TaxID=9531 RepID=A0A2K5LM79_CERAT
MDFTAQPKPATALCGIVSAAGEITYPLGVKEITNKITTDEMIKHLKMVVKTFMDMAEDSEDEKQQSLYLASEFSLRNPNKDVCLLVADIFCIYAPEGPYTSHDKLKDIFLFITRQLKGLKDTKSPQFNRYFYLLENLAWVKSCNICFELEDCNEIFIQLFRTFFSVINNSHNKKVQMHVLDLMSYIIMEGDRVTQELLDSILTSFLPISMHCQFFQSSPGAGKIISKSSFIISIMPQLKFKLKTVVRLLAKLFGSKDSDLATQNCSLWQCFLGWFNDIHVPVRLESVKFASHCLMNHPDLAKDLTEYLKVRSHDPEEAIHHDVIVTLITAAKRDLALVNDQLLGFVRERTLDKWWQVRKELFKKYCLHGEAGKEAAEKVNWIKDKPLHIYYQNSIDDKLLVEKIFAQYLVPHNLETEKRMKCLYYLYASLDLNAVKALNEMWKCQNMLWSHVRELLDLHKQLTSEANCSAMFGKLMTIAKNLPDPGKAQDFVKKFNQVLGDDEKLRSQLELLISPTCSCKQADICVREIAWKLANPNLFNLFIICFLVNFFMLKS